MFKTHVYSRICTRIQTHVRELITHVCVYCVYFYDMYELKYVLEPDDLGTK